MKLPPRQELVGTEPASIARLAVHARGLVLQRALEHDPLGASYGMEDQKVSGLEYVPLSWSEPGQHPKSPSLFRFPVFCRFDRKSLVAHNLSVLQAREFSWSYQLAGSKATLIA